MTPPLTRYQKELAAILARRYGRIGTAALVEELCRIGVIDHTRCKVLAIRRWVDDRVAIDGIGKIRAMHMAADHFASTFDYIRKCVYHYRDVNVN